MEKKFQPVSNLIVISDDKRESVTDSGLIIASKTQEYNEGVVLAVGDEVSKVKVGNNILFYPKVRLRQK